MTGRMSGCDGSVAVKVVAGGLRDAVDREVGVMTGRILVTILLYGTLLTPKRVGTCCASWRNSAPNRSFVTPSFRRTARGGPNP